MFISKEIYIYIYIYIYIGTYSKYIYILFEEVRFANYPSSLSLCAVFTGSSRGSAIGTSRCSRCSNGMFPEVYRVSPQGSRI